MALTEDIADDLAQQALALARDEDDSLVDDIATALGAGSQTLQEAFMTSIRVRRAEARARFLLEKRRGGSD